MCAMAYQSHPVYDLPVTVAAPCASEAAPSAPSTKVNLMGSVDASERRRFLAVCGVTRLRCIAQIAGSGTSEGQGRASRCFRNPKREKKGSVRDRSTRPLGMYKYMCSIHLQRTTRPSPFTHIPKAAPPGHRTLVYTNGACGGYLEPNNRTVQTRVSSRVPIGIAAD